MHQKKIMNGYSRKKYATIWLIFAWVVIGYLQLHWTYVGWYGEPSGDYVLLHSPSFSGSIQGGEEIEYKRKLEAGEFPPWYISGNFTPVQHVSHEIDGTPWIFYLLLATRVVFLLGLFVLLSIAISWLFNMFRQIVYSRR